MLNSVFSARTVSSPFIFQTAQKWHLTKSWHYNIQLSCDTWKLTVKLDQSQWVIAVGAGLLSAPIRLSKSSWCRDSMTSARICQSLHHGCVLGWKVPTQKCLRLFSYIILLNVTANEDTNISFHYTPTSDDICVTGTIQMTQNYSTKEENKSSHMCTPSVIFQVL